jgi:TonB family protein
MKKTAIIIAILVLVMVFPVWSETTLNIKLNFFGPASGGKSGPGVTTSFYLKSMVQRNLQVTFAPEVLLAELHRTFNAPDVSLLASADLAWRTGGPASVMEIVQIDGRDYVLVLTPLPKPGAVNFKVGVVEERDQLLIKNILLDTEIVLPDGEVAMLGFRDSREHCYFIAFFVQGRNEKFGRDVMRIASAARPKIIKEVKPGYPEEALKKRIEGIVLLEVLLDKYGKVSDTRIIMSPDPLFTVAAVEAVKQWIYEPYIVDGVAKEVLFTVPVTFALEPGARGKKGGDDVLTRIEGSRRPKILKMVKAVYSEDALKNRKEGVVMMEVVVDEKGRVRMARVLSSPSLLLNHAALDAVRQWEYEPFVEGGKAKPVVFNVTVAFSLNNE